MREPHVRDPRADARDFWAWLLFSLAAIVAVYVVVPWLILHPGWALALAGVLFAVVTIAAAMLASKISRAEGE